MASIEPSDEEAQVTAVLAVIGGVDMNFHLGGKVEHQDFGRGTIATIATNGKIVVQFESILELKTCRIQDLQLVCASFHKLLLPVDLIIFG